MKFFLGRFVGWCAAGLMLVGVTKGQGGNLDTIGVTLLRQFDPALAGSGVSVAQVEAPIAAVTPIPFEVNPSAVAQPVSLFSYSSLDGVAAGFPNAVGAESSHANGVGANFFGLSSGAANQVSHVDNYEASFFYSSTIASPIPVAIAGQVVNQSFVFNGTAAELAQVEQQYDEYVAAHGTLFVSGAGNGGSVYAPSTCYNGLSAGVYGASSSVGPTADGRCKPDLTAPGGATSFSTPYVAGAGAVLLQAAARGDGGAPAFQAGDVRTLRALLLNGAVKPGGWTNSPTWPLDARYGAGMLNVFNAWKHMTGGKRGYIEATSNPSGGPHPPGANPNNVPVLIGWDYNGIANSLSGGVYQERVYHYYFNWDPARGSSFALTATLAWNRTAGHTNINDLNLFLFDVGSGSLVTCSTSAVNNVEHIFRATLPAGRYDLQVHKNPVGQVSPGETYGLAFALFNQTLTVTRTNGQTVVSWPTFPAGFSLYSAGGLVPPVSWSPVNLSVTSTTNRQTVTVPTSAPQQFFRLQGP